MSGWAMVEDCGGFLGGFLGVAGGQVRQVTVMKLKKNSGSAEKLSNCFSRDEKKTSFRFYESMTKPHMTWMGFLLPTAETTISDMRCSRSLRGVEKGRGLDRCVLSRDQKRNPTA